MRGKKVQKNQKIKERGITLIALIITIIVLLILAGISLNGIFGESGLINSAQKAKENAEIAEETEIVAQANIIAEGKNVTGDITARDIEEAIDKVVSKNNTTVIDDANCIIVKFNESNRYYIIDGKGAVEGPIEKMVDEYAGDISKGKKDAGKSEEDPFVINCIEDLVAFSIMAGGGNSELGLESNKFANQFVILSRTLDFKSIFSYNDHTTKKYGDLNGDGTTDNIKTELTKQGDTCGGFKPIDTFQGIFDGKNNKICNLYENRGEDHAGLFKLVNNKGIIQNLGLENITLAGAGNIGGIAARFISGNIKNCYVEGTAIITLNGTSSANLGIICGYSSNIISECYSIGTLTLEATRGYFGGIVGYTYGLISKCFNVMDIVCLNLQYIGGIAGGIQGGGADECYHIGNITGGTNTCSAGIAGYGVNEMTIKNCYSVGNINGRIAGGIKGGGNGDIFNCYSIGKITNTYMAGIINGMNYGGHIVHCFGRRGDRWILAEEELTESQILNYLSSYNRVGEDVQVGYKCNVLTDEEMKTQEFVDELNILIEAEADADGNIIEKSQSIWKMDTEGINNGYPILEWQE